jgi:hypothetical protein
VEEGTGTEVEKQVGKQVEVGAVSTAVSDILKNCEKARNAPFTANKSDTSADWEEKEVEKKVEKEEEGKFCVGLLCGLWAISTSLCSSEGRE